MAALHAQLNRAVLQRPPGQEEGLKGSATQGKALSEEDAKGLAAPSAFVVQELRKALAAGWADQVCDIACTDVLLVSHPESCPLTFWP